MPPETIYYLKREIYQHQILDTKSDETAFISHS
jgi:hypothetical protein